MPLIFKVLSRMCLTEIYKIKFIQPGRKCDIFYLLLVRGYFLSNARKKNGV